MQVYVRPAHSAPEQGMRVSVSDKAVTVDAGDGQPPMEISLPCAVDLKVCVWVGAFPRFSAWSGPFSCLRGRARADRTRTAGAIDRLCFAIGLA